MEQKKPIDLLDFDGNPDRVLFRVRVRWGPKNTAGGRVCAFFNSNNFVTSTALAEVWILLSTILVATFFDCSV